MGIPLFREKSAVAVSPSVKLPIVCPYVGPQHNISRHHHHHHHHQQQQQPQQSSAADTLTELSRIAAEPTADEVLAAGQHARAWRQMPRLQHSSRDRASERSMESHERSTNVSSRYTQRIVRSQPGTREYDDELRAAELVDLYFQELARIRTASNGQDSAPSDSEAPRIETARSRTSTERVMDLVARRQRRTDSASPQSPAMDRRSLHETLVRQHQRSQRSPRVVIPRDLSRPHDPNPFALDQEMQEVETDF